MEGITGRTGSDDSVNLREVYYRTKINRHCPRSTCTWYRSPSNLGLIFLSIRNTVRKIRIRHLSTQPGKHLGKSTHASVVSRTYRKYTVKTFCRLRSNFIDITCSRFTGRVLRRFETISRIKVVRGSRLVHGTIETLREHIEGPSFRFTISRNVNGGNICVKPKKKKHEIEFAFTHRYSRKK